MRITFAFIALLIFFNLTSQAKDSECNKITDEFSYSSYQKEITLLVDDMVTLPENTVFLGGRYHDGRNTIHSAFLISKDAGKSWKNIKLQFAGSSIRYFQTHGLFNIWTILVLTREGTNSPTCLLKSNNGGKSWDIISLKSLRLNEPLSEISEFKFFNEYIGFISIEGSLGGSITYITNDSGHSWLPVKSIQKKEVTTIVEKDYKYPNYRELPIHAPLWTRDHDYYKITNIIRIQFKLQNYIIENYSFTHNQKWTETARIPRYYQAIKGNLIMVTP